MTEPIVASCLQRIKAWWCARRRNSAARPRTRLRGFERLEDRCALAADLVTVDEGSQAVNAGTFADFALAADIAGITPSVGGVSVDQEADTWSWSFNTTDGPEESQPITLTATDINGAQSSIDFDLVVNNLAPTLALNAGVAPSVVLLQDLGKQGITLHGFADYAETGRGGVSAAGDVNGDGFADVIVGAPFTGFFGQQGPEAGEAYVLFGGSTLGGAVLALNALGAGGFTLSGFPVAETGMSVAGAGDVNGDGFDDVIVGTDFGNIGGHGVGNTYIVFGGANLGGMTLRPDTLGTAGFTLCGFESDGLGGMNVAGAGDVNGDGFGDMIVGMEWNDAGGNSRGEAYVIFGGTNLGGAVITLNALGAGGFTLRGFEDFARAGYSVSGAGDVNSDGFDEVIVSALATGGGIFRGESYVVYGGAGLAGSTIMLNDLGSGGFTLRASKDFTGAGSSVSGAGDFNGDGFGDMIVGASNAPDNQSGEAYVVFGGNQLEGSLIDLNALGMGGLTLEGFENIGGVGGTVSAAGDVNADGFADVVVGAEGASAGGSLRGEGYVVFGGADLGGTTINLFAPGRKGFTLRGSEDGAWAGSVSGAGDVNGDGFADLIVGGMRTDAGGIDRGAAYVVFGSFTTVNEGARASRTGTFADLGNDVVTISASVGAVVQTGTKSGTWEWSFDTSDPDQSQTVTITAIDSDGAQSAVAFELIVRDVAPSVSLSGNAEVNRLTFHTLHVGDVDPGPIKVVGLRIRWGDGTSTEPPNYLAHHFAWERFYSMPGQYTIRVDLLDEDGTAHLDAGVFQLLVRDQAPNLMVKQTVKPAAAARGAIVTFTIQVVNLGQLPAYGSFATFQLPKGLTRVTLGSTRGWVLDGFRSFRINLGDLAPGQRRTLVFKARVGAGLRRGVKLFSSAFVLNEGPGLDSDVSNNTHDSRVRVL